MIAEYKTFVFSGPCCPLLLDGAPSLESVFKSSACPEVGPALLKAPVLALRSDAVAAEETVQRFESQQCQRCVFLQTTFTVHFIQISSVTRCWSVDTAPTRACILGYGNLNPKRLGPAQIDTEHLRTTPKHRRHEALTLVGYKVLAQVQIPKHRAALNNCALPSDRAATTIGRGQICTVR
jgi:hypothetical protein